MDHLAAEDQQAIAMPRRNIGVVRSSAQGKGIAVATVVAAGLVARLVWIGRASLWYDESFSWHLCRLPIERMLAKSASDVHPPLYYVVLRGWIAIWGDSVVAMRLLSALAGTGCVVAAYWLGWAAADGLERSRAHATGLCAAALIASNGFLAYYAQQVRMYSIAVLLAFASTAFLIWALREPSRRVSWAGYATALGSLILTHHYGLLLAASHAVVVALALIPEHARGSLRSTLAGFSMSTLLIGLIVAPAVPTSVGQLRQVQASYWTDPWRWSMIAEGFINFTAGRVERVGRNVLEPTYGATASAIGLFVMAALVALVIRAGGRRVVALLVAALFPLALLAIASALGRNVWVAHSVQIFFAFLPVAIAVAIWTSDTDRGTRLTLSGTAFALSAASYAYAIGWSVNERPPGLQRAAEFVNAHRRPGDEVVINPSRIHYSFLYYLTDRSAVTCGPPWEVYQGVWNDPGAGRYILAEAETRSSASAIIASPPARVWIIDGTYPKADGFMPPDSWRLAEDHHFREWFPPDVEVRLYLTSPSTATSPAWPSDADSGEEKGGQL